MKSKLLKIILIIGIILLILVGIYFLRDRTMIGKKVDSYKNVEVYYNGLIYTKAYGKNYSDDGYYYGQKWQCVEYIKRFYFAAKGHKMPDVYGNAKDFFDPKVSQGQLNSRRGLIQFRNGDTMKPEPDDLVVFTDTKYGHVAIVTEVSENYIEVIQQNIYGKSRERYELTIKDNKYFVGSKRMAAGWLRKK
jgi:surface antigen